MLALAGVALATLGGGAHRSRATGRTRESSTPSFSGRPPGLMLMAKGTDLLVVFIGLELMSIAALRPRGLVPRASRRGRSGDEVLPDGGARVRRPPLRRRDALRPDRHDVPHAPDAGALAGTASARLRPARSPSGSVAILAALAFKLALVPFHAWAPDVYQGMTTPAVTFLSTVPKAAAVVVASGSSMPSSPGAASASRGGPLLVDPRRSLSILFGNVVALAQRDLKRMLAYSGIAQMGYVAIALATFDARSRSRGSSSSSRATSSRTSPPSSPWPRSRAARRSRTRSPTSPGSAAGAALRGGAS